MKATTGNTHKTKMRKYVQAFTVSHREMIQTTRLAAAERKACQQSFKVRPSTESLSHLNQANQESSTGTHKESRHSELFLQGISVTGGVPLI